LNVDSCAVNYPRESREEQEHSGENHSFVHNGSIHRVIVEYLLFTRG
jgi:hypothetical protein